MKRGKYQREGFGKSLDDFAFVTPSALGHLARRIDLGEDAGELLRTSWSHAYETGLVVDKGDEVIYPVWRAMEAVDSAGLPKTRLMATIRTNTCSDGYQEWVVVFAGPERNHALDSLSDNPMTPRDIQEFAYMPWQQVLEQVAGRAKSEKWGFRSGDMQILRSYLKYTYQRGAIQGNVYVNTEMEFAAFRTGLVTEAYEDLYLCFTPNERYKPQWKYAGVCVAAEQGLGKRLTGTFGNLPPRVTYFEEVSDFIYDSTEVPYVDIRHVVIDNVDRLPHVYLLDQLYDQKDLRAKLENIFLQGHVDRDDYRFLRNELNENPVLFRRLKRSIEEAVSIACKRTEWNYRTAVPCYYPTRDSMSLLLPLYLEEPEVPSVALVVTLAPSGNYQGETVLTMEQAYMDARLICKPEEDWLIP